MQRAETTAKSPADTPPRLAAAERPAVSAPLQVAPRAIAQRQQLRQLFGEQAQAGAAEQAVASAPLHASPRVIAQRQRLRQLFGEEAQTGAQASHSALTSVRRGPLRAAQLRAIGASAAGPVVQRAPINTGNLLEFFDPEIPAHLKLVGFVLRGDTRYARYRVQGGVEFLYDYNTGLYHDTDELLILPGSLKPVEEVAVGGPSDDDDPPPGRGAIKVANEAILQFNLIFQCECPLIDLGALPRPLNLGAVLRRMLLQIALPDLLQLINEWRDRTGQRLDIGVYFELVKTALLTPEANVGVLQALLDVVVTLSDLIIEQIPAVTGEELGALAQEDRLENDQSVALAKCEQALNELGGDFKGQKSPSGARQKIIKDAFLIGCNLARLLKVYKNKSKDRGEQVEYAILELRETIDKYIQLFEKLTSGLKVQKQVPWELVRRGLNAEEVIDLLKPLGSNKTVRSKLLEMADASPEEIADYLLSLRKPTAVVLDPGHFEPSGGMYETGVIDVMLLDSLARAKLKGHTLPVNKYVERHLTPVTMKFLASHPSMYIEIYEGQVSQAFSHLVGAGYTEVLPFSDNPSTDFRKFTARNPLTGQAVFVVVGLSGIAYQKEIAAHFLYYTPAINPLRIIHQRLALDDAPCVEFERTLESLKFLPDIIQMGNVDQVERLLGEKGIKPLETLSAPNLFGKVYLIGERIMFSLKVEPQLYGDRAGAFLRAVQKLKTDKIHVIFTGTAGGLAEGLEVGDLLAPELFHQSDTMESEPVEGVTNLASPFFSKHYGGGKGMFSGGKVVHGAVDSILMEDKIWFGCYQQVLTIVEQETAHLAKAARLCAERTDLYVFFKISDLLGSAHDFTANETDRPEYRTPVIQGNVVMDILKQIHEEPKKKGKEDKSPQQELATLKQSKELLLFQTRDLIIKIAIEVLEILEKVDPEFAKGFVALVESVVNQGDPKVLLTRLSRLFGYYHIVMKHLTVEYPPTFFTLTCKTPPDSDDIVIEITTKSGKVSRVRALSRGGKVVICETGVVPRTEPFIWKVFVGEKLVFKGEGVGGERHKGEKE